jgi:hypothetical protein
MTCNLHFRSLWHLSTGFCATLCRRWRLWRRCCSNIISLSFSRSFLTCSDFCCRLSSNTTILCCTHHFWTVFDTRFLAVACNSYCSLSSNRMFLCALFGVFFNQFPFLLTSLILPAIRCRTSYNNKILCSSLFFLLVLVSLLLPLIF